MRGGTVLAALSALALLAPARAAMADCKLGKVAEFPVTMVDYKPLVPAKINGVDGMFIAETGDFFSMLTPEGAAKFKLAVGPGPVGLIVTGTTGRVEVGLTSAHDFTVLGQTARRADFLVMPHNMGRSDGALGENLLSFTDAEFDFANGIIRFWEPDGCRDAGLAYWATTAQIPEEMTMDPITPQHDAILGWAKVNGVRVRVKFDTGASLSKLTVSAARRAGLRVDDSDVKASGQTTGAGNGVADSWITPVSEFEMGGEQVANTHLRIGRIELEDADMLIGADWFLSHRVYVAKSQNKLYFTYNGGPVFNTDQVAATPAPGSTPPGTMAAPGVPSDEPSDAAGFVRRGDAFLERSDLPSAIADFGRAIDLEPNDPQHYVDRGRALWRNRQAVLAMADFDQAIKLKPDYAEALVARGTLRLETKDDAGAVADFDAATKPDPTTRFAVAAAYLRVLRYDQAIVELDQWLAAYPKDERRAAALNNRCWARAMLNRDLDKALADCDEAVKLLPGETSFLDGRAMVYLRMGQLDRSIADFDTTLKHQRTAWALYGRGLVEEKKGLKTESDADIAAATALDPKLPDKAKRFGLTP